jgi:hypothetical protein
MPLITVAPPALPRFFDWLARALGVVVGVALLPILVVRALLTAR